MTPLRLLATLVVIVAVGLLLRGTDAHTGWWVGAVTATVLALTGLEWVVRSRRRRNAAVIVLTILAPWPALADGGVDDQNASAAAAERSASETAGDAAISGALGWAGSRCCGLPGAAIGAGLGALATQDGGESPDIGHGDPDPSGANPSNPPGGGGFGTSNDMM